MSQFLTSLGILNPNDLTVSIFFFLLGLSRMMHRIHLLVSPFKMEMIMGVSVTKGDGETEANDNYSQGTHQCSLLGGKREEDQSDKRSLNVSLVS